MKVLKIIKYIFTLVGLGLLVGGYFWYSSTSTFLDKAITTEGTVVDMEMRRSRNSRTYAPVVVFMDQDGQSIEFVSSASSSSPDYSMGEKIQVLYQPDNPRNASINSFFGLWGGPLILGGLGTVFFAIGGGLILKGYKDKKEDEYLRKHGQRITTNLQEVRLNKSLEVNGRYPYIVVTQWQDPATSKIHEFESDDIWFDPTGHIDRERIQVLIEEGNPQKYQVDLSFLPEKAE